MGERVIFGSAYLIGEDGPVGPSWAGGRTKVRRDKLSILISITLPRLFFIRDTKWILIFHLE